MTVPVEDIARFEAAKSDFVTAYMQLKSEKLANHAAEASRLAYEAITSLATHDVNDLSEPTNNASVSIMSVAARARLLYYGRESEVDWSKSPITQRSMSDHPLERLIAEGRLRVTRTRSASMQGEDGGGD